MNPKIWLMLLVVALASTGLFLTGCDFGGEREEIDLSYRITDSVIHEPAPERDVDVLRFGFTLRVSPLEDARQYMPFLRYLEKGTGHRFELRFSPEDGSIVDDLGKGVVQLAAVGAGVYIPAHAKYGAVLLAHGLNAQGEATYQSVIVVSPKSTVKTVEELRGKRFAFGSITSTQGHLIPRIVLSEHGLKLADLAAYECTGSHRNCADAVVSGRFDAGGMQDTIGRRLAKDGLLRILHTSKRYPSSGIAANKDVPQDVLRKIKQALLDFEPTGRDAAGLYHWDRTEMAGGFIEAREGDYAEIVKWAEKLGYLDTEAKR